MTTTYQSEYLPISSVAVRTVNDSFRSDEFITEQWEGLNYLQRPVFENAEEEYDQFLSILKYSKPDIHFFSAQDGLSMDAIYCRDASIVTEAGVVLCRMGKEGRRGEPESQAALYKELGIPILGRIGEPGTLEGGDVLWLDEKTLAVGETYRTNQAGIQQLKRLLEPNGVEVIAVPLPHYKGPGDVFHLMSIISPVDRDLAVVYSPLMPIFFRDLLLDRGYRLVEVPEVEFESMGCNVLALAPSVVLMVDGNLRTQKALEDAGCLVHVYAGNEISIKGGGGPTCLTRPLLRKLPL